MIFGTQWGSGWGSPDRHVDVFSVALQSGSVAVGVSFSPATGFEDAWWGVYVGCVCVDMLYIGDAADLVERVYALPPAREGNSVIVLHLGHAQFDAKQAARVLDGADARQITLTWTWRPIFMPLLLASGAAYGHDSAWTFSGLSYKGMTTGDRITRRKLDISISVVAAVASVSVSANGITLASGSAAIPGTVTLSQVDSSGVSGSVALDGTAITGTGELVARYPSQMDVYLEDTDPPATLVASVAFNELDGAAWTSNTLDAATYYAALAEVSDTGTSGTLSASVSATIGAPPAAPTGLHYDSGNAAATVVHWAHAIPASKTFNVYVQKIGDAFMDVDNPAVSVVGLLAATLPAQTGYPGTITVLVRCADAGLEEHNLSTLAIEYDASGNYIAPRPNAPTIQDATFDDGTLTVNGIYAPAGEAGTGYKLQLFLRASDGSYNFSLPAHETVLTGSAPLKTATLTETGLVTAGWYYCTLKAATSAGVQSADYASEVAYYVDTVGSAAPSAPLIDVARG